MIQARSFGVMTRPEEMDVRGLITRTTEVLKRASASPDDIGARYARLLELLWKPKQVPTASPTATHRSNELQLQSTFPNSFADQNNYVYFSPANDFSWLDLEAVGDYVSGDQIPGAGSLGFDTFQNPDLGPGEGRSQMMQTAWMGDISTNLFF